MEAFLAASRQGDFDRLVSLLDPDVILRVDGGAKRPGFTRIVQGAEAVASGAFGFRNFAGSAKVALINGAIGGVAFAPNGSPIAVMSCVVRNGKIVEMDALADPERLRDIDLTVLGA